MGKFKDVKEEIRKDVNEYIRQSEKLDGNKSFKKTYDEVGKHVGFLVELNGGKMKITMLLDGKPWSETTISDMDGFDCGWDIFMAQNVAYMKNYHKLYFDDMLDSFKKKMDEFIEMDDLFEPFIVKNKRNSGLDIRIDLKTDKGYSAFSILFEQLYGFDLDVLCDDFILPQLDVFNEGMSEYGTMILKNKDDERMTFAFDPTSRLGRLIVSVAAGMRMHKEEEEK